MSEFTANYQKVIQLLTEAQFRDFVLLYHKEHYAPCEATFVDGPYDGGIDVEVRKQHRTIKVQTQVTIQSSDIENKIMKDVGKAAVNVQKYDYLDTLYFFVNQPVSNSTQMKLRQQALAEGINLQIQDSKFLAERTTEYPSLISFLSHILDIAFANSNSIDPNIQIVYDAVSQQSGIKAIKDELIKDFFLKVLYDKKEATIAEISEELDIVFMKMVPHHYYESMAGKLKGTYIDVVPETTPKQYFLLQEAKDYISSVYMSEKTKILELRNRFEDVCSENGLSLTYDAVYPFVEKLYDDNTNPNVETSIEEIEKHYQDLTNYIKNHSNLQKEQAEEVASKVLSVFEINDFAGKQSASKLLFNLFKDNKLDMYLANKERHLLFDTPVLIQYICFLFKNIEDYHYLPYQYVRSLTKTIDDPNLHVFRFTMDGYLKEVVAHLSNAILVGRFLGIPEIQSLGKSKNSFYNFYNEVLSREDIGSIDDYICEVLGVDTLPESRAGLESVLYQTLRELLEIIGLEIEERCEVDNWVDYKKEYDFALINTSGEKKSPNARTNDLNAILYLSYGITDYDNYLVTWDTSFEKARTELRKKHHDMNDWFLYSPQQLAGTLSLLNFKINPTYVTGNILSLVEGSIASNNEARSFVDTFSEYMKGSSDSQMKVAKNFAKIRAALFKAEVTGNDSEDEKPIDDILVDVLDYTAQNDEKYELFVEIMQSEEHIQGMVDIISKHLELLEKGGYDKEALNKGVEDYFISLEQPISKEEK